jgi:hypothetical protein
MEAGRIGGGETRAAGSTLERAALPLVAISPSAGTTERQNEKAKRKGKTEKQNRKAKPKSKTFP